MRKTIIAANWKMHKTDKEALQFMDEFAPLIQRQLVYIAAPFTALESLVSHESSPSVFIGAQNMSEHYEGAYTGEISVKMLKSLGVQFVLIGHSERRQLYHEGETQIASKVKIALQEEMPFILCVGETFEEYQNGKTEEVLKHQLTSALHGIHSVDFHNIILAYEPIWAIGTGEAATPQLANQRHSYCRQVLEEMIGKNFAQSLTILYGGSVKPENAKELLNESEIDGFLVGGASLDPQSFAKIVNC